MQISELITELQKVQKEHGDIEVAVQYRDEGGNYPGWDNNIELFVYASRKCII